MNATIWRPCQRQLTRQAPEVRGRLAAVLIVALAAVLGAMGCRRADGLTQVSGTVVWKNERVMNGTIMIEPDSSQGNGGPQSLSTITDGKFCTRWTHGSVSGPVMIEIHAYGELADHEFPPPLFPPYIFKTNVPQGTFTLDIIVPDNVAASPPRRSW
jgi:hypothetical protein